ncbi:phosphate starvation-inducible protein PhoH [Solibacillus sp. FSL H8-0523]|uniref:phosphate starvation-inducible protein PhoH n=1 Tax=Solibacillus sp. FSL H8-0523 TaxID=2954511 RepID=UPI0031015631
MKDFLVVHPRNIFSANPVQPDYEMVDMYQLHTIDLSAYKCMIILGFVDQDYLLEQKQVIADFLQDRKIVSFFGDLVTDWLPGQEMFIPKEIKWHGDYDVQIAKPHPIFEGVTEEDMTINRGVKGFFARGHHPAPENAEVLLTLPGGATITYIDRESTNGTIFVHSGGSLFNTGGRMQPVVDKTTDRIPAQIEAWAREEYNRLQKGEKVNA